MQEIHIRDISKLYRAVIVSINLGSLKEVTFMAQQYAILPHLWPNTMLASQSLSIADTQVGEVITSREHGVAEQRRKKEVQTNTSDIQTRHEASERMQHF